MDPALINDNARTASSATRGKPMLRAVPKGCFSSKYIVSENDTIVASVDFSAWKEAAELTINSSVYRVYRDSLMGPFLLEGGGSVLARAEKPSAFYRTLVVQHFDKQYKLEATSAWSRKFILSEGEVEIGSVYDQGVFKRTALADLPEAIPLAVRMFMLWLVMVLWRRSDSSTG